MATEDQRRLGLPDRRQNTYDALEEHLDKRLDHILDVIHSWIKRGLIAFSIIAFFTVVAVGGLGYLLRDEVNDIRQQCLNRNIRHDNAVTVLMVGSNLDQKNADTEEEKAEIRRRRDVTLGLIDSVAPKVDCENPKEIDLIQPRITPPPSPTP